MDYLLIKTLHIISSTIVFGTGIGTAFFMFATNRFFNKNVNLSFFEWEPKFRVSRIVILADTIFTTPFVIIQPITGLLMLGHGNSPFSSQFWVNSWNAIKMTGDINWLGAAIWLYISAAICWLPVVWLQLRMHQLLKENKDTKTIPGLYWKYEKIWSLLGVPAFFALIVVFWLMTAKPF